jgi:hypothetical protein
VTVPDSGRPRTPGLSDVIASEFAAVRVTVDRLANGPRLLVEDLDTGVSIYLEPLELASFCLATEEDRLQWLNVGAYRIPDEDRRGS